MRHAAKFREMARNRTILNPFSPRDPYDGLEAMPTYAAAFI